MGTRARDFVTKTDTRSRESIGLLQALLDCTLTDCDAAAKESVARVKHRLSAGFSNPTNMSMDP